VLCLGALRVGPPAWSLVVPAGAMTALGGKPQTTRKANTLHTPYAPRGSKLITPSPARGRGKRAGDPARGYREGSPKPPSPKGARLSVAISF